jgi:hypothetical protein
LVPLSTTPDLISGSDVLGLLVAIATPIIPLLLTVLGKMVWDMRKRIAELEEQTRRHSRTLYGDAEDPTHDGLAEGLSEIQTTLADVRREVSHISRSLRDSKVDHEESEQSSASEDAE